MAWLNLTMHNQTAEKGLMAKKIKLPQMNFFLEKQLIKFSCTYWSLSFCKILKRFLVPIQSYEDVLFSSPIWPICHEQEFFGTNITTYWPFSLCEILKNSYSRSRVMKMHHFGPKMVPLPQTIFFWKIINIILIHLLAPFIVHSFKKILPANPELWGCTIFGPKRAYFPKWEFLSEIKVRY